MPIKSAKAGPFVTVLTVSGEVGNSELRARLDDPEVGSRNIVLDLSAAVLLDAGPFPFLAEETTRLAEEGVNLVVVTHRSMPGVRRFRALNDAMMDVLGDVAKLGDWPPAGLAPSANAAAGV